MTLITPEERMSQTAELLQSLEASIRGLRQAAEELRRQIGTGEDADLAGSAKQLGQLEGRKQEQLGPGTAGSGTSV